MNDMMNAEKSEAKASDSSNRLESNIVRICHGPGSQDSPDRILMGTPKHPKNHGCFNTKVRRIWGYWYPYFKKCPDCLQHPYFSCVAPKTHRDHDEVTIYFLGNSTTDQPIATTDQPIAVANFHHETIGGIE